MLSTKRVKLQGMDIYLGDIVKEYSLGKYYVGTIISIGDTTSTIELISNSAVKRNKKVRNYFLQRWEPEDRI
jgi:hypothetical protein